MKLQITIKNVALIIAFCAFLSLTISAQIITKGSLNIWTKSEVARKKDFSSNRIGTLTRIRSSQHQNFDRIVFEFADGSLPQYQTFWVKPPFFEGETDVPVKIAGAKFLTVQFYPSSNWIEGYTVEKRNFPMLRESALTYNWEGTTAFTLGLKSDTRFRVLELENPTRLVVDFKH
jgi:hypothetical protein